MINYHILIKIFYKKLKIMQFAYEDTFQLRLIQRTFEKFIVYFITVTNNKFISVNDHYLYAITSVLPDHNIHFAKSMFHPSVNIINEQDIRFFIDYRFQMWATSKKSRMVSQLQVESKQEQPTKIRGIHSIEGRVVVLCLSTWYFGVILTQVSDVTPQMWAFDFPDMTQESYIGPCFGLVPLGAALGVVIAHFTMNKFNRRIYLIILNLFCIGFTAAIQAGDVYTLFIFRILQGVVAGIYMNFIPTYISEITPKELGSRFGVYPQIAVVLGVLVSFVVAMIMTDVFQLETNSNAVVEWQADIFWRVMCIIPVLAPLLQLFFIAIGYIPQSPYSLIVRNRRQNARDVLALFYEEQYVNQILQEREKAIFEQSSTNLDDRVQWTGKGYFLGFMLSIFQVLTGIASYVTQAGHVMTVALNQPVFGLYTPILLTISQLIGTFISIPMLRYIQWRYLTIIGGFALSGFNALTGLFFYLYHSEQGSFGDYAMTLAMVTIMAFMFTFGITVGSSVWPYVGFMMPSHATLVAQVINWLLAGFSIICFSFNINLEADNNPWIMIWVYTGVTFLFSVLNWIFMIDIKGLSVRRAQLELAK